MIFKSLKNFSLFLFVFLSSCDLLEEKKVRIPVASVHEYTLYKDDLKNIIPSGLPAEDSIVAVESYINKWIRQTLLLRKAEQNLKEEQKDFEQKIEDYRRSLITYTYQNELINQLLDTLVSPEEIEEYYNQNSRNFELKENIVKVNSIIINKKKPKVKQISKWFKSNKLEDINALDSYCYQHAEKYSLDDSQWILFDDLLKEIPIKTYNKEEFLKRNKYIELDDENYLYYLKIKEYKVKNSTSPLSFEEESIRKIIINKRKMELIKKMKNDIYEEAIENNEIKYY